jgi:hypothetical protein
MRGRIWWLWICMTTGAVFCIVLGKSENSFGQTMAIVVVFSIFIQVRCCASFFMCPSDHGHPAPPQSCYDAVLRACWWCYWQAAAARKGV